MTTTTPILVNQPIPTKNFNYISLVPFINRPLIGIHGSGHNVFSLGVATIVLNSVLPGRTNTYSNLKLMASPNDNYNSGSLRANGYSSVSDIINQNMK